MKFSFNKNYVELCSLKCLKNKLLYLESHIAFEYNQIEVRLGILVRLEFQIHT